jgi:hypothetical protein
MGVAGGVMADMPELKNLSLDDQKRYRALAHAVCNSLRAISRGELDERGFQLRAGKAKSDILYYVLQSRRERETDEAREEYVAQQLVRVVQNQERRTKERVA